MKFEKHQFCFLFCFAPLSMHSILKWIPFVFRGFKYCQSINISQIKHLSAEINWGSLYVIVHRLTWSNVNRLSFFFFFCFFLAMPEGTWKFLGQVLNLCCSSDNAGSLTCWATRELPEHTFFIIKTFLMYPLPLMAFLHPLPSQQPERFLNSPSPIPVLPIWIFFFKLMNLLYL